jgi:colicin import membrane protein
MPGFVRDHIRPLAGSTGLHVLLIALIAATAWRWSSSRPPVPMAIEGVAVDERSLPKDLRGSRPKPAQEEPAPAPAVATPPPPPDEAVEREREAEAERERAAEAAREQAALEARQAEEAERMRQQKLAAEEAERKAAAEEAERKAAAEEAARKAAAEEAQRRKAAEAEKRKAAEEAARRREAAEQQARVSDLQRRIEAEEAEEASMAASGVVDEYRAALEQAIERNWIRPPSAQPGLECTLYVTQAPGGTVLDVRLGACNGDAAVRESITNACFRASPLPPPADPRAFARRLEIVFRPTE